MTRDDRALLGRENPAQGAACDVRRARSSVRRHRPDAQYHAHRKQANHTTSARTNKELQYTTLNVNASLSIYQPVVCTVQSYRSLRITFFLLTGPRPPQRASLRASGARSRLTVSMICAVARQIACAGKERPCHCRLASASTMTGTPLVLSTSTLLGRHPSNGRSAQGHGTGTPAAIRTRIDLTGHWTAGELGGARASGTGAIQSDSASPSEARDL
ncbi:hypothetical protein C8Q70DRAFT_123068 [Cubamyces menziesii]|nr:hypothetical protein C8Q70DRAFT_123068 [Cubamyces menziesii]